jgi:tRNA(fMet)-specific endonuclease VapC
VIAQGKPLLLDTNIVVGLLRGKQLGLALIGEHALGSRPERPLLSVISAGELRALAEKWSWGSHKKEALEAQIRQLVVVDINRAPVLSQYAAIANFTERVATPSRSMGQNDMWIAATAAATGAVLLTCDSDFDHLAPTWIELVRLEPKTGTLAHAALR